jgi:phosphoglycerate dehydrogenase-like enzyme
MKKIRVVVVRTEAEAVDFLPSAIRSRLESIDCVVQEVSLPLASKDDWPGVLNNADVLVAAWGCPSLAEDLPVGGASGLKYVAYLAGSVRKLVPRVLIEHGLQVTNWGSTISRTISECGLLLILSAMRRASYWSVAMHRDGAWKQGLQTVTQSLYEKRVGLHGFGQISQGMVPLLRPFGVTISAYSPSVPDEEFARHGVHRSSSLENLFSENDVVVELAPYHSKNHHIVTGSLLRSIPSGGVFVNIGRGAVVDESAMIDVARERADDLQIGLDVYEKEPLALDSPLRGLPNVALLPHIAGPTKDRRCDSTMLAIENIERMVRGETIPDLITPDIYDRAT